MDTAHDDSGERPLLQTSALSQHDSSFPKQDASEPAVKAVKQEEQGEPMDTTETLEKLLDSSSKSKESPTQEKVGDSSFLVKDLPQETQGDSSFKMEDPTQESLGVSLDPAKNQTLNPLSSAGTRSLLDSPTKGSQRSQLCGLCPKAFSQLLDLNLHKRLHVGESFFPCSWCEKVFACAEEVKLHMLVHRICSLCGKMYQYPSELQKHLRSHTGERPYKCDICAKRFSRATVRNRHQRNHSVGSSDLSHHRTSSENDATDSEEDEELEQDDELSGGDSLASAGKLSSSRSHHLRQRSHPLGSTSKRGSGSITCLGCQQTFMFPDQVNPHIHQVEGDKPFLCPDCGKTFPTKVEVVRHLKSTFEDANVIKCNRCDETFSSSKHCRVHKMVHHICPVCGKFSRSAASIEHHIKKHSKFAVSRCEVCEKELHSSKDLLFHLALHGGQLSHPCLNCGQAFSSSMLLEEHTLEHKIKSIMKPFPCAECGEIFSSVTELLRHKFQHSPDTAVECHWCGQELKAVEQLDTHMADHIKSSSYCEFCGENFFSTSDLKEHLKQHQHGNKLGCEVCGKTFRWKFAHDLHVQSHAGRTDLSSRSTTADKEAAVSGTSSSDEVGMSKKGGGNEPGQGTGTVATLHGMVREDMAGVRDSLDQLMAELTLKGRMVECRVCGQGLTSLAELEEHQHTRLDSHPHQCSVCRKSFAQSSNLLRHMRTHTGYRMHKCPLCNKAFTCQSELRRHSVVHTGYRPYVCAECGRSFSQKGNYLGHMRRHVGRHTVSCQLCGVSFTCVADLNKHLLSHSLSQVPDKGTPTERLVPPTESPDINVKPFRCEECGRDFRVQQAFFNHRCKGSKRKAPATITSASSKGNLVEEALPIHFGVQETDAGPPSKKSRGVTLDVTSLTANTRKAIPETASSETEDGERTSKLDDADMLDVQAKCHHTCHLCNKCFDLSEDLDAHLTTHSVDSTRKTSDTAAELSQAESVIETQTDRPKTLESAGGSHEMLDQSLKSSDGSTESVYSSNVGDVTKTQPLLEKPIMEYKVAKVSQSSARLRDSKLKLKCYICGTKQKSPSDLSRHMTKHSMERLFACSLCSKKFKQRFSLVRHQRSHSGKDCHQCVMCPQVFTSVSDLKRHLNLHSGSKPFQCKICGRQFCQRGNFNRHKLKHQKGNDYVCRICNASLTNAADFQFHLVSHRGEKAFAQLSESRKHNCRHCGKTFLFLFQMKKHVSTCHSKKKCRKKTTSSSSTEVAPKVKDLLPVPAKPEQPEKPERKEEENESQSESAQDERSDAEKLSFFQALQISHISTIAAKPQTPQPRYSRRKSRRPVQAYKDFDLSYYESDEVPEGTLSDGDPPKSKVAPGSSHRNGGISSDANDDSRSDGGGLKKWQCSTCGETFKTEREYLSHIKTQCPVCNKLFLCKDELESHSTSHPACPYCQKLFAYPSTLKNHMRCHTGETPFECEICGKKFRQSSGFYRHRRSHPMLETVPCTVCDRAFCSPAELQEHMKCHIQEPMHKCHLCPAAFIQPEILQQHLLSHRVGHISRTPNLGKTSKHPHLPGSFAPLKRSASNAIGFGEEDQPQDLSIKVPKMTPAHEAMESFESDSSSQEETLNLSGNKSSAESQDEDPMATVEGSDLGQQPVQCPACGKTFKNETTLLRHEREIHGSKRHACSTCSRSFSYLSQLVRHLKMHSENRPHTCYKCGKVFPVRTALERHRREVHRAKKSYSCAVCGKNFMVLAQFEQHLKDHRMNAAYQCKVCGVAFGVEANLWAHMEEHALKAHNCDVCGLPFSSAEECRAHMDTHGLDKPYRCKVCGKGYGWMSNLKSHMKSHSQRQHSCQECNKSFVSFKDLKVHMRVHSGEKPFQCDVCSKSFTQSSTLYTHKRIMHQMEFPNCQAKDCVCGTCGKIFHSENALKLHSCSSDGRKLYSCEHCPKIYTTLGGLSYHRKTKHGPGAAQSQGFQKPEGAPQSGTNPSASRNGTPASASSSQTPASRAAIQQNQSAGASQLWEPSHELLYQGFL